MYRIYPTLLNSFAYYEAQTLDSQGNILVNTQEMLDRINRVRKPTTQAQQKGIDFEKAVVTGENEDSFNEGVIEKARELLPPKYKTQFYSSELCQSLCKHWLANHNRLTLSPVIQFLFY